MEQTKKKEGVWVIQWTEDPEDILVFKNLDEQQVKELEDVSDKLDYGFRFFEYSDFNDTIDFFKEQLGDDDDEV